MNKQNVAHVYGHHFTHSYAMLFINMCVLHLAEQRQNPQFIAPFWYTRSRSLIMVMMTSVMEIVHFIQIEMLKL